MTIFVLSPRMLGIPCLYRNKYNMEIVNKEREITTSLQQRSKLYHLNKFVVNFYICTSVKLI